MTGCAPPSTRRAVRVVSSKRLSRPHGDRQAWPRRRCRVVTGAASSISRLVVASRRHDRRRDGCLQPSRASATRSSSSSKSSSPVCRPRLCTLLRGLVCVVRSFRSRARRGCNPQNPLAVLPCFLGNETALCPRARQRFVADGCARVLVVSDLSSTIMLVELAFCYDRVMCLSNEPI